MSGPVKKNTSTCNDARCKMPVCVSVSMRGSSWTVGAQTRILILKALETPAGLLEGGWT